MGEGYNKIPYDAVPISREGANSARQAPLKNQRSLTFFMTAIFLFNILISAFFIYFLYSNKNTENTIYITNEISAETTAAAAATSKAKLSAVCIGAGGGDALGISFSAGNVPDYNEILTRTSSRGAGVIIKANKSIGEAYILTCNHVISGYGSAVFVLLYDSYKPIYATVVGRSVSNDLAVLKIVDNQVKGSCQEATIANSSYVAEGDTAIAIGNPQSGGFAVTVGTISRTNIIVSTSGLLIRSIQVDTAINKGNSGGGLFDKNGNLIGIVESKSESSSIDNVAFAVHSNTALSIANNLIEGRHLQYADAGYTLETRDANLQLIDGVYYKIDQVYVLSVEEGSDAAKAGLQSGDQIVAFTYKGRTVQMINCYSYDEIKYDLKVGDVVEYSIIRGGVVVQNPIKVTISSLVSSS